MDLENELELFMDAGAGTQPTETQNGLQEPQNDDILGLDQQIKLTTRAKIAKIDNERVFDKNKGISYIIRNYGSVVKTFKKNDKKLAKRLASNPDYSSKYKRQLKHENEIENLSSVLQFYQLWCHGLFPKARFKDCLHLVRSYGQKSAQMRLYRRELLDQEIEKLKQAKGIASTHDILDTVAVEPETVAETGEAETRQDDSNIEPTAIDDDWSFMNVNRNRNRGLFVDDDDDDEQLYNTPNQQQEEAANNETKNNDQNEDQNDLSAVPAESNKVGSDSDSDPFSDDDAILSVNNTTPNDKKPEENEEFPAEDDIAYSNEYEVMREMGL